MCDNYVPRAAFELYEQRHALAHEQIAFQLQQLHHEVTNGLGARIAKAIAEERKVERDEDRAERKLELEQQKEDNRAIGQHKDRIMKWWLGVVSAVLGSSSIVTLIIFLLSRGDK